MNWNEEKESITYHIKCDRRVNFDGAVEITEQNRHRQQEEVGGISSVVTQ